MMNNSNLFSFCVVQDNIVTVRDQLERKDYLSLKRFFLSVGGIYIRGGKFRFSNNNIGDLIKTLLAMDVDRDTLSFFPTPTEAIESLVDTSDILGVVLEPSAGQGAIVQYLLDNTNVTKIIAVELDPVNFAILKYKFQHNPLVELIHQDFLTLEPFFVDQVYMNPPFSVNRQPVYQHHITHALKFLRNGGILTTITSTNIMYRSGTLRELRNTIIDLHGSFTLLPKLKFGTATMEIYVIAVVKDNERVAWCMKPYAGYISYKVYNLALLAGNVEAIVNLPYTENYEPAENNMPLAPQQLISKLITAFPTEIPDNLTLTADEYNDLAESIWPDLFEDYALDSNLLA